MISEGIHSAGRHGKRYLVLHGLNTARQPADDSHPFGYGKSSSSGRNIVAISIFAIGGGMSVYAGISYIRDVSPDTPMGDPTAAYIVLGLSRS